MDAVADAIVSAAGLCAAGAVAVVAVLCWAEILSLAINPPPYSGKHTHLYDKCIPHQE